MERRVSKLGLVLIASVAGALLVGLLTRIAPESSPIARGADTPGVYMCLECHGGTGRILAEDWSFDCKSHSVAGGHPRYEGRCEDLLAYFAAVRVRNSFPERMLSGASNRVLEGEKLARKFYCFQCHGELGQGGFPNAGALKGYIPGYFGEDFRRLTNDGTSTAVRAWITDGINPDLLDSPIEGRIVAFFIEHQAIQMPQFDSLTHSDIDLLVDYVLTLHAYGPMDVDDVRMYDNLTRLPFPLTKYDMHYNAEPGR